MCIENSANATPKTIQCLLACINCCILHRVERLSCKHMGRAIGKYGYEEQKLLDANVWKTRRANINKDLKVTG